MYNHLFDMMSKLSSARQVKTLVKTELYNYIIENILSDSIKPNIKYTLYYSDKYEIISKYNLEKIEVCT